MNKTTITLLFCVLCLLSCRTQKVSTETLRTDTIFRTEYVHRVDSVIHRDSIYLHDSVFVTTKGDTTTIERWHTQYRDRWHTKTKTKTDTIYIEKKTTHDSKKTQVVEKQKANTFWQRLKSVLAAIGICCIIGGAISLYLILKK